VTPRKTKIFYSSAIENFLHTFLSRSEALPAVLFRLVSNFWDSDTFRIRRIGCSTPIAMGPPILIKIYYNFVWVLNTGRVVLDHFLSEPSLRNCSIFRLYQYNPVRNAWNNVFRRGTLRERPVKKCLAQCHHPLSRSPYLNWVVARSSKSVD
jgi:hypothetical protein